MKAAFSSCADALRRRDELRGEPHLFAVHVENAADVNELRRLCGGFVGHPVVALLGAGKDADGTMATFGGIPAGKKANRPTSDA